MVEQIGQQDLKNSDCDIQSGKLVISTKYNSFAKFYSVYQREFGEAPLLGEQDSEEECKEETKEEDIIIPKNSAMDAVTKPKSHPVYDSVNFKSGEQTNQSTTA